MVILNNSETGSAKLPLSGKPLRGFTLVELLVVIAIIGILGSHHAGGVCQFVMGDGSVQALTPEVNTTVLGYLGNIRDGQTIPPWTDLE
ncbi:MAG: prepilin-type N-terminal cleavage/methylation domain-containing protein [Pirellulales bacterium]|nr:prepilin-type N-terminal cleavage/methylation domain-containing protein [Pirellulales bacterium]